MGGDGIRDVSAGADEGVGKMVNGTGLTSGSVARSGACGGGSSVRRKLVSNNKLAEVGGFRKVTEGGLVRRSVMEITE